MGYFPNNRSLPPREQKRDLKRILKNTYR